MSEWVFKGPEGKKRKNRREERVKEESVRKERQNLWSATEEKRRPE